MGVVVSGLTERRRMHSDEILTPSANEFAGTASVEQKLALVHELRQSGVGAALADTGGAEGGRALDEAVLAAFRKVSKKLDESVPESS